MEVSQEYEDRFLQGDVGMGQPAVEELAANLNFNAGVEFINQVISYERILFWGYLNDMMKNGGMLQGSNDKGKKGGVPVAFGRRITEKPVVGMRQRVDSALSPAPSEHYPKLQQIGKESVHDRFSLSPKRMGVLEASGSTDRRMLRAINN